MRFGVVVADPPWAYSATSSISTVSYLNAKEGQAYTTAKSENLHDIGKHLARVTEPDSILFCWVTGPMLPEGLELIKAWGYPFSQVAFVWEKVTGTPGSYTFTSCEFVLVGRRGRIPSPYNPSSVRQFLSEKKDRRHSKKPEEIQSRIEAMFPGHNYLELFARREREGWVCLGNELTGNDIRTDLDALALGAAFTKPRERRGRVWKKRQINLF